MPRVGEFCSANIARLLLMVFIAVVAVLAVGAWFFYLPGRGTSIEQPHHQVTPAR